MKTEQIININSIRELLPKQATVNFQRKKGQTGKFFLEVEVTIKPSIEEKAYYALLDRIQSLLGEDLIELYTEDTGRWFFIYIRMSSIVPTTVIP